jgi:hypothetical protein
LDQKPQCDGECNKKRIIPFCQYEYQDLLTELADIEKQEGNEIEKCLESVRATKSRMKVILAYSSDYKFETSEEEISFVKDIKVKFLSRLFYFQKIYHIELSRPLGGLEQQETYLSAELEKLRMFFMHNIFFYQYARSGQTYLDEHLFITQRSDFVSFTEDVGIDPLISSGYETLFAKIESSILLEQFISKAVSKLRALKSPLSTSDVHSKVRWTDSKTALIELCYALHAAGVFNRGNADLKDVIEVIQSAFSIDLGNTSRTFQEILSRKTGYTNCIDKLKAKLLERIDEIEA